MQKCSEVWKKVNKPKSSELIISILGSQLKYPVVTRWNSLYDSVRDLIKNKENLNKLCTKLETQIFHEKEIKYLEEFIELFKPIADGIDFLQQTEEMIYGYLLPTLATIRTKLLKIDKSRY